MTSAATYLIDTSVIINWERSSSDDDQLLASGWVLSAMTIAELNLGTLLARTTTEQQRRLTTYMLASSGVVLPFDETCARTYAELVAWADAKGHRPSVADAVIASTAATHGLPLATMDHGFERLADFDGLELHVL